MKKLFILISSIMLAFSFTSCGIEESGNSISIETTTATNSQKTETVQNAVSDNTDWKQFLKEYETWVDKYIEITKKYKSNPSDFSIVSDYTKMMSELANWSSKTESIQEELGKASSAELAEYSSELARIATKIAQATY